MRATDLEVFTRSPAFFLRSNLNLILYTERGSRATPMFVPGIISLAFYKRRPSRVQVILGLVATIVLSALLGYISPSGSLGQVGSVILAVGGGGILFFLIFAVLLSFVHPRHPQPTARTPPPPA